MMVKFNAPLILAITAEEKSGLSDLTCSDFEVAMITRHDQLENILSEQADRVNGVLLADSLPLSVLRDWMAALRADKRTRELPIVALSPPEASEDFGSFLRSVADIILKGDSELADIRVAVNTVREEFRVSVQLRRELERRTSAIGQIIKGEFRFQTREEAQNLATMLSMACKEPVPVAVGLAELLINAVEHGSLEIGHVEKGRLIEAGLLGSEIKERRTRSPFDKRNVSVQFERNGQSVWFRVEDDGPGFDHYTYQKSFDLEDTKKHGRGIFMAANCFDEVSYEGRGNIVIARKTF